LFSVVNTKAKIICAPGGFALNAELDFHREGAKDAKKTPMTLLDSINTVT
jgi:hypothetical protein